MSEPTCADCACWRRVTDAFGICRRYPPVPLVPIVEEVRMFWSETRPDAWCAEHRPGGGATVTDKAVTSDATDYRT